MITSKPPTKEFHANWHKIYGRKKVLGPTMRKSAVTYLDFATKMIALGLAVFALKGSCSGKERTDAVYETLRESTTEDLNRIETDLAEFRADQIKLHENVAALTEAVNNIKQSSKWTVQPTLEAPEILFNLPNKLSRKPLPKSLDMLMEQRAEKMPLIPLEASPQN